MRLKDLLEFNTYCILIWRISHIFAKLHLFPIAKIFWLINRIIFANDIDPYATIGKNFKIIHGMGVVIGRYCIIGNNVKIYQNVTLGGNNGKKDLDKENFCKDKWDGYILQPVILDDVTVFSNAVIAGPIVVGKNSIIGANSVVTKTIPSNSVVKGVNKIYNKGVE